MPSLRERVTTYFRQLSFIAEPREDRNLSPRHADGSFITKYLEGRLETTTTAPDILSGKEPDDLTDFILDTYPTGSASITGASTGPNEGLTGIKRSRLHLSAGPDIDFIDTIQEQEVDVRQSATSSAAKSIYKRNTFNNNNINNNSILSSIGVKQDQNANKISNYRKANSRKNSIATNDESLVDCDKKISIESLPKYKNDVNKSPKALRNFDTINQTKDIDLNNFPLPEEKNESENSLEPVASVSNWNQENDHSYGISISLYENNPVTNESAGNPIADCFGLVTRENATVMALADGVNWGEGARMAARSAVHGCLVYIDTAIFGQGSGGMAKSTREVFISLLRSFWEAHACILEVSGATLTTLTVAVILPLAGDYKNKYAVCSCNVGDSLGYVYSKTHGVREFTQGSHDIESMRDMRDALGALGPVDGNKPELSNLTLSLTVVEAGDIVFLTSDGISDNFDPVVGKFAEALTSESQIVNKTTVEPMLAPKRQNKSTSHIMGTTSARKDPEFKSLGTQPVNKPQPRPTTTRGEIPLRPPRTKKSTNVTKQSSAAPSTSKQTVKEPQVISSRPKYMRSLTVIEPRSRVPKQSVVTKFPKSKSGLPLVTGQQRHTLTLLRLADLLCYGINGTLKPCTTAKRLCHLLIDFVKMITSAKKKLLEQREFYYKIVIQPDGVRKEVELSKNHQRAARKRMVESSTFSTLPGKLDHATVVAYTVGSYCSKEDQQPSNQDYTETNF